MPRKKSFPRYTELFVLMAFLGVLGYLFFSTSPEQVLQTVSVRSASPEPASPEPAAAEEEPPSSSQARSPQGVPDASERATEVASPSPDRDDFGLLKNTFRIEEGRVESHQTFADLLTDAGVDYATAVALAEQAKPVFNVRHIQAGKRYRLYRSGGQVRHLVYQRGPVGYVSFSLGDSLTVDTGERPVQTVKRTAAGTVERSLYAAIDEAGADASLAQALAEVYAWQIDFFRLQPGDRFRVVYEEKHVGGESIGAGRVLGVRFEHRGDAYYGLYLPEEEEYFDEDGNSLRKSLLQAPLDFARISSGFQKRRYHPVLKKYRAHEGTDYAADKGTPVYSVGDGRVTRARYGKYNGYNVKIRHNETYATQYLHFSKIADGIEPGTRVKQKQVIGYVGETGLATGPHVHYIFRKNGQEVDPYEQELPSAPPVADSLRSRYDRLRAELLPQLRPQAEEPAHVADAGSGAAERGAAAGVAQPAASALPPLLLSGSVELPLFSIGNRP